MIIKTLNTIKNDATYYAFRAPQDRPMLASIEILLFRSTIIVLVTCGIIISFTAGWTIFKLFMSRPLLTSAIIICGGVIACVCRSHSNRRGKGMRKPQTTNCDESVAQKGRDENVQMLVTSKSPLSKRDGSGRDQSATGSSQTEQRGFSRERSGSHGSTERVVDPLLTERHSNHAASWELDDRPEHWFSPKFGWYVAIRPGLDFVVALLLLACLSPIIIVSAIAVKLTSPGPAFYCQTRLGRNGRKFTTVKLRTMVHNAEESTGPVWAASNDPRTTPVGRFLRNANIDEFPQLVNVITGRMGLIGPRPERPEIAMSLEWDIPNFRQRLRVRPGITGLAQLLLPADANIEDVRKRLRADAYYIRNMNPLLDAQVSFYTMAYLLSALWHTVRIFISLPWFVSMEQRIVSECGPDSNQQFDRSIRAETGINPPESYKPCPEWKHKEEPMSALELSEALR